MYKQHELIGAHKIVSHIHNCTQTMNTIIICNESHYKKVSLMKLEDSCLLWQVASSKDSPSGGRDYRAATEEATTSPTEEEGLLW